MTVRKHLRVSGRVQGVFYRDSVRREAERRGVAGWARNCSDGSVEAVFEGAEDAVARMIELARSDPGHSRVEACEVTDEPAEGLEGFRVG